MAGTLFEGCPFETGLRPGNEGGGFEFPVDCPDTEGLGDPRFLWIGGGAKLVGSGKTGLGFSGSTCSAGASSTGPGAGWAGCPYWPGAAAGWPYAGAAGAV